MSPEEIKHRFRQALLGYVILAVACVAGIAYNFSQGKELKDHQKTLNSQFTQIEEVAKAVANNTAITCLVTFAQTSDQEVAILKQINQTGVIDLSQNPTCQQLVMRSASLVIKVH